MFELSKIVERKFIDSVDLSDIEIMTDTGWEPITHIHKTVPYKKYILKTLSGIVFECADTHIVFDENMNEVFVKDLNEGDLIQGESHIEIISSVIATDIEENMYDITVNSDNHRFYTNSILSHNTTILQGISYALYGQPLTNIRKDNLVNSINTKNMLVTIEYEVNGKSYKIERGRKPNVLRYYIDDGVVKDPSSDEGHGESKWTQNEIEKALHLSHTMFKNIVVLHTKTTPFLNLGDKAQRDIIEELMGITQLSAKAEILKEQSKQVKEEIRDQDVKIKTMIESNEKIQRHINELQFKSTLWEKEHTKRLTNIAQAIAELEHVDVEAEIKAHQKLIEWASLKTEVDTISKDISYLEKGLDQINASIKKTEKQMESVENHSCPTCKQELHSEMNEELLKELTETLATYKAQYDELSKELLEQVSTAEPKLIAFSELGERPQTHYRTIDQAYEHRTVLDKKTTELEREDASVNPYIDQIANLNMSSIQEISYDYVRELTRLKEHQDFLLKLLTNKDSFIRKKIIDQNLSFLNFRLNYYLTKLLLPHEVVFKSDLSVTITNMGKDYDFDQLSNGEANRVVLALSWSFRDMWENLNMPLNLVMIDELVDSGLDSQGTDASLSLLKQMAHERGKNIFLISHKDGLETRVDNVLLVQKEAGFTNFSTAD